MVEALHCGPGQHGDAQDPVDGVAGLSVRLLCGDGGRAMREGRGRVGEVAGDGAGVGGAGGAGADGGRGAAVGVGGALRRGGVAARALVAGAVPDDAVDRGYGRDVVLRAHLIRQEGIPDLPREHGRIIGLVAPDRVHHLRRRHLRLRPSDHARLDAAGLVIPAAREILLTTARMTIGEEHSPAQDLADAAVRHAQLSADVTGPHALVGQPNDLLSGLLRKRPSVDEDSAQLIDPAMTCRERERLVLHPA